MIKYYPKEPANNIFKPSLNSSFCLCSKPTGPIPVTIYPPLQDPDTINIKKPPKKLNKKIKKEKRPNGYGQNLTSKCVYRQGSK